MDIMNLESTTFYNVGIIKYADFSSINDIAKTNLTISLIDKERINEGNNIKNKYIFKISNTGETIALLLELKLYLKNKETNENEIITPIFWSDNYFSIRNGESNNVTVEFFNNNNGLNEILFEIIGYNCEFTETLDNIK